MSISKWSLPYPLLQHEEAHWLGCNTNLHVGEQENLKKKENIYHRKEEIHTKETLTSKFEELENSKWSESNLYSLLKE